MSRRIDPDECPVKNAYRLFGVIMQGADDQCVAHMRRTIGQMNTGLMENILIYELAHRQRANDEAAADTAEQLAQTRKEEADRRARDKVARSLAKAP